MNAGDIVQRTYDRIGHNPNLEEYRASVMRRLGDVYDEVNDSALWLFLQATANLQIRASVVGTATPAWPGAIDAAVNRRLVNLGVVPGRGATAEWAGAVFETTGSSSDGVQYTIGRVTTASQFYLSTPYSNVPPFNLDTNWRVTFPRYPVPADCSEVLGITSRGDDQGRLTFIDRKKEELAYLDADSSGEPAISIEDDWRNDRAPPRAPTLVNNAGVGTLAASTEYEYCYTFIYEGRESPPSPTASITTGAGANRSVDLSGLEDTSWDDPTGPSNLETRRGKRIYRRDLTNRGPWQAVGQVDTSTSTTFSDTVLVPTSLEVNVSGDVAGLGTLLEAGPREHLRLWFTPDTDKILTVRYHRRPRRLVAASDVPEWPVAYHKALVDLVMADIFRSAGLSGDAERCEKRAEKVVQRMAAKHLTRTDRPYRFGRWDRELLRRRYANYGPPSIS